jgi:hypothetical protein
MFSIHYLFKDDESVNAMISNFNLLKSGGYFICCLFDGNLLHEKLKDTKILEEYYTTDSGREWLQSNINSGDFLSVDISSDGTKGIAGYFSERREDIGDIGDTEDTDDTGDTGFPVVALFTLSMSSSWLTLLALVSLEEPFVFSLIIVGKLSMVSTGLRSFSRRTLLYMSECSSSTVEI